MTRQGSESGSEERERGVVGPTAKWKSGHKQRRKKISVMLQNDNQNKQSKTWNVAFLTPSRTCESEFEAWYMNCVV